MSARKVFSDDGKMELSYHVTDGRLSIEIIEEDIPVEITLGYEDALQFIAELNRELLMLSDNDLK